MVRICCITAAVMLLAASWASAGTFQVLADAGGLTGPFFSKPVPILKTAFKPGAKKQSEIELESDIFPDQDNSELTAPVAIARPAAASKKKKVPGAMAPPPVKSSRKAAQSVKSAAAKERAEDLDLDLAKDLVLPPPPPATEKKAVEKMEPAPEPASKPIAVKPAPPGVEEVRPQVTTKKAPPERPDLHASVSGTIRKVRPITGNGWNQPAGTYIPSVNPWNNPAGAYVPSQMGYQGPQQTAVSANSQANPYSNRFANPYEEAPQPQQIRSYVRDGVTVRLVPRPGAVTQQFPQREDDQSTGSEVLNTAADILGMPFAFISSFF